MMSERREAEGVQLIERGAPRCNQALVGILIATAWWFDVPLVLPGMAVVLWVGAALGRRFVPGYALYYGVIRPIFGPGWLEDERMPRFAQAMGATGILGAYAAIDAGAPQVGWALALSLAGMALWASVTTQCAGCLTYWMLAKLRGVTPSRLGNIDTTAVSLPEIAPGGTGVVAFHHPLCSDCQVWNDRLAAGSQPYARVDVSVSPDVASSHGIAVVPSVFEVDAGGSVLRQLAP